MEGPFSEVAAHHFQLALGYAADAGGAKVGVPRLNAAKTTQTLVARLRRREREEEGSPHVGFKLAAKRSVRHSTESANTNWSLIHSPRA